MILCPVVSLWSASTAQIQPMKICDDKTKAPASCFLLAGAWSVRSVNFDSTLAASETVPFSGFSRCVNHRGYIQ